MSATDKLDALLPSLNSWAKSELEADESSEADSSPENPWPKALPSEAYCGLIGDIVKAIEPETESDPAAVLLQVAVAFGALVGRGPHVRVEGDEHHPNLFALLVGDTSKARKGTSWGRVREIFSAHRTGRRLLPDCPAARE